MREFLAPRTVTAAVLIIGNEILSGRTKDANLSWLADHLNTIGIRVLQARVVADVPDAIIAAVNETRLRFDYVFTTGGIGPTHDDITADAIAAAKEDGRVDAKDYVRRAFSFQHPLRSVFQTPPSSKDYHSLLRALPDNGQQAVTESIRLFNRYGERLGIAPFTGQPTSSLRPDRTELLRRQAGEVFSLQNALSF